MPVSRPNKAPATIAKARTKIALKQYYKTQITAKNILGRLIIETSKYLNYGYNTEPGEGTMYKKKKSGIKIIANSIIEKIYVD